MTTVMDCHGCYFVVILCNYLIFQNLQVDYDLQQAKMQRLESDIQEMSITDGKDDKQVWNIIIIISS